MAAPVRELPVSLVLPCYQRHRQTEELLRSLAQAAARCEIILVDDCSPTPLKSLADKYSSLNVTYLCNAKNLGPAQSRNIGVKHARNDTIAFTDNDCLVTESWLEALFDSLQQARPNIAAIGGRVLAHGKGVVSRYFDYHKILDPWFHRGTYHYITTANAMFRRRPFEHVGGFDDSVRTPGGEDPGLCFKLLNAGYGLGYAPDAVVYHQYDPSVRSFMRTFFRYGYGCSLQSARHFRAQPFVQDSAFGGLDHDVPPE